MLNSMVLDWTKIDKQVIKLLASQLEETLVCPTISSM